MLSYEKEEKTLQNHHCPHLFLEITSTWLPTYSLRQFDITHPHTHSAERPRPKKGGFILACEGDRSPRCNCKTKWPTLLRISQQMANRGSNSTERNMCFATPLHLFMTPSKCLLLACAFFFNSVLSIGALPHSSTPPPPPR